MIINDERNAIENTKESLSNLIIAITVYAHTHTYTVYPYNDCLNDVFLCIIYRISLFEMKNRSFP